MNRRWLCSDVWMDIFPHFDHAQLGLKLAQISPRFNALVDKHFDGKSELTIWRPIKIRKDSVAEMPIAVSLDRAYSEEFPLPDRPLRNKIRFKSLQIKYIDHSVIAFLRANQKIWDRSGTKLDLYVASSFIMHDQPIWNDFLRQIWPIFAQNIRHLSIPFGYFLVYLRRVISPTILTDLNQLNSINSNDLCPDGIADDGPNATAGQALSKWLHTPAKDGQAKRLRCNNYSNPSNVALVNNFKKKFLNATTSVRYKILITVHSSTPIGPFELVNERTNEKLTLIKASKNPWGPAGPWLMKRCQIGQMVQWEDENWDHLNNVIINLLDVFCSWPLSPPTEEEEKKKRIKATEIN